MSLLDNKVSDALRGHASGASGEQLGLVTGVLEMLGKGSKDTLLNQAKALVTDLTSMKSGGNLAPSQVTQVDNLLPKATSLTGELEKPQVDAGRLPQLASWATCRSRSVPSRA